MMLLFLQTDRFLHLQTTLLKSVILHPHRGRQLARSQGWTVSLHKNLFLRNCVEGRQRKLDGATKKVGRRCVHVWHLVCLPPFLPPNFKEQAGRSQGFHNHVRDPKEAQGTVYSALKTGIAIACANKFKVQQGLKFFSYQPRNQASDSKFTKYKSYP